MKLVNGRYFRLLRLEVKLSNYDRMVSTSNKVLSISLTYRSTKNFVASASHASLRLANLFDSVVESKNAESATDFSDHYSDDFDDPGLAQNSEYSYHLEKYNFSIEMSYLSAHVIKRSLNEPTFQPSTPPPWNLEDSTLANKINSIEAFSDFMAHYLTQLRVSMPDGPLYTKLDSILNRTDLTQLNAPLLLKVVWFYSLDFRPFCQIRQRALDLLAERLDTLSDFELVNFCLFMTMHKSLGYDLNRKIQRMIIDRFSQCAARFCADDLAVVSLMLVKNKERIVCERLVDILVEALQRVVSTDSPTSSICLLKSLPFCRQMTLQHHVHNVLQIFVRMPMQDFLAVPVQLLSRLVVWMSSGYFYDQKFVSKLKLYLNQDRLNGLRLKELRDFAQYFAYIDRFTESPSTAEEISAANILSSISKAVQLNFDQFEPEPCFLPITVQMCCIRNVYNETLIEKILSKKFVVHLLSSGVTKKKPFPTEALLYIDGGVAIERPEYGGPRLDREVLDMMQKNVRKFLYRNNHAMVMKEYDLMQIATKLCSVLKLDLSTHVHIGRVLPHFLYPSILVKFKDGEPLPVGDIKFWNVEPVKREDLLVPEDETWICLIPLLSYTAVHETNVLLGHYASLERHLLSLGYKVAVINGRRFGKRFGFANSAIKLNTLIRDPKKRRILFA